MSWQEIAHTAVQDHGALQDPVELAAVLGILSSLTDPVTAVEIGIGRGGTTWALSQLPHIARIVAIDPRPPWPAGHQPFPHVELSTIPAPSHLPATVDETTLRLGQLRADVILIDGAHDYNSVRVDWELYSPLAARGGVVIFHDTQGYPGRDDFGVGKLFSEVRAGRPSIELVACPGGPCGTGLIWP